MLSAIAKNLARFLVRRGSGAARARLAEAFDQFHAERYAQACERCEAALALDPRLADAEYLLGMLACHGQDPDSGARALERALVLSPGNRLYMAALADARLLQQREDDAFLLYRKVFPELAAELDGLTDEGQPWRKAHPDWLKCLRNVSLPKLSRGTRDARRGYPLPFDEVASWHLLNFALLFVVRRRVRAAIRLLERVVEADARLGYAQAALALLYTLNQDWRHALAAARAARTLATEVFEEANALCILAAQLGMEQEVSALDPVFDWSAFAPAGSPAARDFHPLPLVEGLPCPQLPSDWLVCLICCDSDYLVEHGVALVSSIREKCTRCAIHVHVFNPDSAAWSAVRALQHPAASPGLHVTWETVDFDRYGGKALYCSCARFARLHQLMPAAGNRMVMLDADSLVRGDLGSALDGRGDIGLVRAPHEPLWHRYLAGFTMFRRSPAADCFLGELAAFLASNLAGGHARRYIDQIGLYVCARRIEAAFPLALDHLPIEQFCDTLFEDKAIVWSITQGKEQEGPFAQYKRFVMERHEALASQTATKPDS